MFYVKTVKRSNIFFTMGIMAILLIVAVNSNIFEMVGKVEKLKPIYQGAAEEPKIAFACNVFWGEEYLPAMFEIFAAENIHITFFLGGSWVKKNAALVKEMTIGGHELGNHSLTHPHPNVLNKQQNKEEIIRAEEIIYDASGSKTQLYAPPYGEFNQTVLVAAHELGYKTIMWTIDTIDWQRPAPEIIKDRVLQKLQNGAIILMHPTAPTMEALPSLIQEMKRRGYTIVPVSEILK